MAATYFQEPYQRVVVAVGMSNLADGIRMVALPLLAVQLSGSALMLAIVLAAGQAPWLLLGLWAGGLTDRVDRVKLAQRVALSRAVLLTALAALIVLDAVPMVLLIVASFILGISEVLADNVNSTLIPALVHEADLEQANSHVVGAEIAGNELIGPALGGVLFAVAASIPFFTNATLLALAFLFLAGLPLLETSSITTPESELLEGQAVMSHPGTGARIREGINTVLASPLLRTITWSSALLAAVDGAWFTLLALLVTVELGLSAPALGVFLALGAVGGLAGAAFADRKPGLSLFAVALSVFASMSVSLAALSLFPSAVMTAAALIVTSAGFAVWNVFMVSARQRATPNEIMGRVGAAYRTVVAAAALLGMVAGGFLADVVSIQATLLVSSCVLALGAVPVLSRLRVG